MNFYETLGIAPGATEEEISKAYSRKAMECHPDRNPGDPDAVNRFRAVQEAYEALIRTKPIIIHRDYTSPPQDPNNWTKDAPPPTHDIWGDPINGERPPPKREIPKPRKTYVQKYEPEVDLWTHLETKTSKFHKGYWQHYETMKHAMAYEEPEKFWAAMDEWTRNNK